MKKKIFFLITIIIFLIILILVFYKNTSKISKIGHTNTSQEIVENLLNISSYKATIDVKVISNKNENQYIIKQEYQSQELNSQEVIEPSNIAGTKIIKEGNKLTLENTRLNLSSIIEDYQYISANSLDLSSFIEDYKNDSKSKFEEDSNQIKMYTANSNCKKILYIDKTTELPTQLEIENTNKKNKVYILYNEVIIK
mgnify:CR=1 FL=1